METLENSSPDEADVAGVISPAARVAFARAGHDIPEFAPAAIAEAEAKGLSDSEIAALFLGHLE